jgi:iron complex transport system ATP-binding protein
MIEVTAARKEYGALRVVDDVDLRLPIGGVTSIIGPNGAGKSTLVSLISRLTPLDAGTVRVHGLDVSRAPSRELARRLAILRQENHLTARLTVRDLVAFGRYPHTAGRLTIEDERHIAEALAYLDLESLGDRFLDELSGGQRQRAFVAMALAQDTDHLLLDEPLNNLDPRHAVGLMKLLRRLADERDMTIVVVMHDINVAAQYADEVVAMRDGRVEHHGPVAEVITAHNLSRLYETPARVDEIAGRLVVLWE